MEKGTIVKQLGHVDYEVEVNSKRTHKHANQMRSCSQDNNVEVRTALSSLLGILERNERSIPQPEIVEWKQEAKFKAFQARSGRQEFKKHKEDEPG